jgi:hypothetical protein
MTPTTRAFRGSFTRPSASLSTLRRRPYGIGPRKTRFRLVANLCRAGFSPAGFPLKGFRSVDYCLHRFLLSQASPGAQCLAPLPRGSALTNVLNFMKLVYECNAIAAAEISFKQVDVAAIGYGGTEPVGRPPPPSCRVIPLDSLNPPPIKKFCEQSGHNLTSQSTCHSTILPCRSHCKNARNLDPLVTGNACRNLNKLDENVLT